MAGADLTQAPISWLPVPIGVLPETVFGRFLLVDVRFGTAASAGDVRLRPFHPEGWWAISVPVPEGSIPGTEVRLVVDVRGTPRVVPGLLIRSFDETTIEGTTALVAIPEGEAGAVAAALADGALSVLVGPPGYVPPCSKPSSGDSFRA